MAADLDVHPRFGLPPYPKKLEDIWVGALGPHLNIIPHQRGPFAFLEMNPTTARLIRNVFVEGVVIGQVLQLNVLLAENKQQNRQTKDKQKTGKTDRRQ